MKEDPMNKKVLLQELADGVARRKGVTKKDADAFVRIVFELIEQYLESDKIVKIKGFGTFKLVSVDSRESVNVNTGERIRIKGHTKISFTPDAVLRDQVNKPFADFETVVLSDGIDLDEMEQVDVSAMEFMEDAPAEPMEAPENDVQQPPMEELSEPADEKKIEESDEQVVETESLQDELTQDFSESENPLEETVKTEEETTVEIPEETPEEQTDLAAEENPTPPVIHIDNQHNEFQKVEEQHVEDLKVDSQHVAHQTIEHQNIVQGHVPAEASKGLRLSNSGLLGLALFVLLLMGGSYFVGYYQLLCPCNFDFLQPEEPVETVSDLPKDTVQTVTKKVVADSVAVSVSDDSIAQTKEPVSEAVNASKPLPKDTVTSKPTAEKTAPKKADVRPERKQPQVPQGKYVIVGTRRTHTIAHGETLRSIAFEEYGSKGYATYIIVYNGIENPNDIPAGKVIKLPELKLREE